MSPHAGAPACARILLPDFILVVAALLLCLPAAPAHAMSDGDRDGFALLLLGPKENPVKSCAISAIRLNLGLTMQKIGKASDEQVRANLVETLTEPRLRELAEEEYAQWVKEHRPDQVAEIEFHGCLWRSDIHLRTNFGAAGPACFNFLAVPAMAESYKLLGTPRAEALERMHATFGANVRTVAVDEVTTQVYDSNHDTDDFLVHRTAFVKCVRSMR